MMWMMLATIWVWDRPVVEYQERDGIWQAYVCKSRLANGDRVACFEYGEPSIDLDVACPTGWWNAVKVKFPGEEFICSWVKHDDIDVPLGTQRR